MATSAELGTECHRVEHAAGATTVTLIADDGGCFSANEGIGSVGISSVDRMMTASSESPLFEFTAHGAHVAPVSPPSPREASELHRIRRWGLAVLGLQFVVLALWSLLEANRAVQTGDIIGFYRAWYLISHGVLNPSGWWQAQAIFIMWPLAVFGLIWPHLVTLLLIQDAAIVGAEAVAFYWITDIIRTRRGTPFCALSIVGLMLLVLDPWIYWSASWDYHSEALGTLFAVLAARELFRGRKRGWIWSGLTLLSGLVPATYIAGIGLGMLFVRRRRIKGLILGIASSAWVFLLIKLGSGVAIAPASSKISHRTAAAFRANPISGYFSQATAALVHLEHHWVDLLANVAPSGMLGVFTAPAVGVAAVVLGENGRYAIVGYITPSFQSLPIYIFMPIGTVVAIGWLYRRLGRRLGQALMVLASLNVVGWGVLWIPEVVPTWLRVSAQEASVLKRVAGMIPEQDGVVASQGIAGDFGGREYAAGLRGRLPLKVQVTAPTTWFVIAPYAGIEVQTVVQSLGEVDFLASDPRARLVEEADNIWVFRLSVDAKEHARSLQIPKTPSDLPAALFESHVGTRVLTGPVTNWRVQSNGKAGALFFGDYWLERVGTYVAGVQLKSSGRVRVEVWNTTTDRELARRNYDSTRGLVNISIPVKVTPKDPSRSNSPGELYYGIVPFHVDPIPSFVGNMLEVRVYVQSGVKASVYSVWMRDMGTG